jgi:hypothetical protein
VIASFGTGAGRVDVRYVASHGNAAFQTALAAAQAKRIAAGQHLLANNHVHASAAARNALLAGRVDSRLLVTLGTDLEPQPDPRRRSNLGSALKE